MRVREAMNIQPVAKMTTTEAMARKETRFSLYHYRAYFQSYIPTSPSPRRRNNTMMLESSSSFFAINRIPQHWDMYSSQ